MMRTALLLLHITVGTLGMLFGFFAVFPRFVVQPASAQTKFTNPSRQANRFIFSTASPNRANSLSGFPDSAKIQK